MGITFYCFIAAQFLRGTLESGVQVTPAFLRSPKPSKRESGLVAAVLSTSVQAGPNSPGRVCTATPPLFARHSGSQGQTGRFSLTSGGRCSLCQRHRNSGIGRMRLSSLCSSALGPSKVGASASPQKAFGCQRQAKRSACPAERQVGILSKATALNTAYSR